MNIPASATPTAASEQDQSWDQSRWIKWRGLALLMVLISHGLFFTDRVNGIGRVGVNLFFFISGILVFRSLSRTRAKTDWERTRSFWRRRLRRLYPALLAYVCSRCCQSSGCCGTGPIFRRVPISQLF